MLTTFLMIYMSYCVNDVSTCGIDWVDLTREDFYHNAHNYLGQHSPVYTNGRLTSSNGYVIPTSRHSPMSDCLAPEGGCDWP